MFIPDGWWDNFIFVLEQAAHTFFVINVLKKQQSIIPLKLSGSTDVTLPLCAPTPICNKNVSHEMRRIYCDISGYVPIFRLAHTSLKLFTVDLYGVFCTLISVVLRDRT